MRTQPVISIGNCGEYFVAGELERHGFTVAVPMSNTPDFDILAINRETQRQFAIQVKTVWNSSSVWTLSKKAETLRSENSFYVFVRLNELDPPDYYVVPSSTVANEVQTGHQQWLDTPGRGGRPHHDNPMRKYSIKDDKGKNAWDIIK